MRFLFIIPSVLMVASPASGQMRRWEATARSVTIVRDTWGVPHVYGPTDASVVFGMMYAQAEDDFWTVEEEYVRALGRQTELYGDSALAG